MDRVERFLLGVAILMSAATLGVAYLFRFDGYYSAFGRLQWSLGFVFGPWVVAAAVAGLIWLGANVLRIRLPLLEIYFTLVCGGCAIAILEALR